MSSRFQPLLYLIKQVSLPWLLIAPALVLTVVDSGLALSVPLLTRNLIDGVGTQGFSWPLLGPLTIVLFLEAMLGAAIIYLIGKAGSQITADLRNLLMERLLKGTVGFHDKNESGELTSRVVNDSTAVESLLSEQLSGLVSSLVTVIGAVVVLLFLDPMMTAVLFGSVLVAFLIIAPIGFRMQVIAKQTQERTASFTSRLARVFSEIRLVKSSMAEPWERREGGEEVKALYNLGIDQTKIMAILGPGITLGMMGGMVVIMGYGGARVAAGTLAVGTLVAFLLYLFQIVLPLVQMTTFVSSVSAAAGAAERLVELLAVDMEDDRADAPGPVRSGDLVFQNVRFGYDPEQPVLADVNLTIPAGKRTALVGLSGSGKTTLSALIQQFFKPDAGSITHGGEDIHAVSLEGWRSLLASVAQEAPLISGSVRDNLCYGLTKTPDADQIRTALEAARAWDFIQDLDEGLETQVGERGVMLSGGQRQRLAIARAFLRDPEILLLDEATANLDSASEEAVRQGLANLTGGRTTLIIAHRLATVIDADQIVFMKNGRIMDAGTHAELMEREPGYRDLVQKQNLDRAA